MLFGNTSFSTFWMHGPPRRFTGFPPSLAPGKTAATLRAIHILHNGPVKAFSLPIVSNTLRGELFRKTIRRRRGGGASSAPGAFDPSINRGDTTRYCKDWPDSNHSGGASIPSLSFHNRIGRPGGTKVRASANPVGHRTAALNFLRGVKRPGSAGALRAQIRSLLTSGSRGRR